MATLKGVAFGEGTKWYKYTTVMVVEKWPLMRGILEEGDHCPIFLKVRGENILQ